MEENQILNFNFQYDLSPVVLWQYQNAPKFNALVNYQQTFLNTAITSFVNMLQTNFLNIATCNTDGLSMWGQLLGVPRPTYTQDGQTIEMTDEQYRLVLRARIYLLTFNGSIKSLNEFFKILFPTLDIQVVDNYNMTVSINILSEVPPEYQTLFQAPFVDVFLPRPSGVQYIINTGADYSRTFGFEGMTDLTGTSLPGFGPDSGTFDPETSPGGTFYQ